MPLLPFARFSTTGEGNSAYSGERLVNYFARQSNGVSELVQIGRSGLVEYKSISSKPIRAITSIGSTLYVASNGRLWSVASGVVTNIGAIPNGPTKMVANSAQIAIVVNNLYYVYDSGSVSQVSPGTLSSVIDVAYMDGYFILIGSTAGRDDAIQLSGLDAARTFNALDFAFAEESPDALVGILRDHGELYLFGTETTQVFYNSGNSDFPFQPNKGAMIEQGCLLGATIAKADNAVFWVRPDSAVLRSSGSSPTVISTPEIKETLTRSTVTGGFTFSDRGAEFYAVTRENDTTLVYDMLTNLWHERVHGLDYAPWLAVNVHEVGGVEYFGTDQGVIATQDASTYTDLGKVMLAEAVSVPIENGGEWFRLAEVHAQINGGVGGLDRKPIVMMQISRDGLSWNYERSGIVGGLGEYWLRTAWHALGQYQRVQMRFRITDPIPRDIYGVSPTYG